MAKKVKVDVEVDDNGSTQEATDKFTRLQLQIRETRTALQQAQAAGDSVKFSQLKSQLDDLEDSLEINTLKSRQFDDALASIPGPAGQVGSAIKGVDSAFKVLIANPIVAVVAGIAAVLTLMYKALQQTKEGQAALNKITDAFGNILTPIIKFISAVAVPIFEGFAKVINFVGSSIASLTGNYREYQNEIANDTATRKAEENAKRIKQLLDEEGFKYDEFTKKKIEADQKYNERLVAIGQSNDSEAEKGRRRSLAIQERNKAIADADIARAKKVSDAQKAAYDKQKQAQDKALQDRIALMNVEDKLDAAKLDKLKAEALANATTEQEKLAIKESFAKQTYDQTRKNLVDLQSLYKADSKEYKDYQAQLTNLDAKRIEELVGFKDTRKKLLDQESKDFFDFLKTREEIRINAIYDEEQREIEARENKLYFDKLALSQDLDFIKLSEEEKAEIFKQLTEATERDIFGIKDKYRKQDLEEQKKVADEEMAFNKLKAESWINLADSIGQSLMTTANLLEKGSAAQKAIAIVGVLINAASAIGKINLTFLETIAEQKKAIATASATINQGIALSANPLTAPVGGAMIAAGGVVLAKAKTELALTRAQKAGQIAAVGVTSAAQVAAILAAKKEGGKAASAANAGEGAGAVATPAFAGNIQAAAPIIGRSGVNTQGQIGEIIGQAVMQDRTRPIQTYVVGTQVSSQQELDRRITLAARLGG